MTLGTVRHVAFADEILTHEEIVRKLLSILDETFSAEESILDLLSRGDSSVRDQQ